MRLRYFRIKQVNKLLLTMLAGIAIGFTAQPVKAFVPYVYKPKIENLKATALTLGRTAAQLIHYGQIKEANRLAELAVRLSPEDDRLWSVLAETQLRNNLIDSALESLAQAKRISPEKASLWFAEGSIAIQQKNPKKAIYLINKGLKIEPDNAGAYFQLGNARIIQSKFKHALTAFYKASTLKADFWEALNNQGLVLYEMDQPKKAIKIWREVLKIKQNAEPMLALAAALKHLEPNNQESLKLAKQALSINPNYVSSAHQREQLWGEKLQAAAKRLLKDPKLMADVKRASANSD